MGLIIKALKVRIYPNKEQEVLINKTIGCSRFIYNAMLAEKIKTYEILKNDKRALFEFKYKTEKEYKTEFEFLKEVDSISLQQSSRDLSAAYQNFFKSISGKSKGKSGFPKFHKKGKKDSYRTTITNENIKIDFESKKIKLPKLGWINFRDLRKELKGEIKSATVSKTPTGKYFVSIIFEQDLILKGVVISKNLKTKGLDMSMSSFFVDDQGSSPVYERIYRNNEKKLKFLQRKVSKKQKGSNNRKKAQLRVNLLFEKITNKRKDFTQKLSTKLVKDNDVIVVENINLRAMAQCLKLGKSINDLGYGMFLQQLKYKTFWNNKILIEADKWFASSKTCSKCGFIHKDLMLKDRIFSCPSCGFEIDRDQNAGINLKNYGLKKIGLE
ncbi:MAG: RNA-guided endonuclease TnpB family protein [Candidatus Woesearchaeota archaeon]|jgi:putative transposase